MLILALAGVHNLERAALALFLSQVFFFVLGIIWTRSYFTFDKSVLDVSFLYEHLRFGLLFFGANLLLVVVWRAGDVIIVALSGDASEVAFFNIANLIAVTIAAAVSQLVVMLTPSLTKFHISNQAEEVNRWLGFTLKYLTILMFAFLLGVYTFGEWGVQLIWGEEFSGVVGNLKILAIGLLAVPLIRIGLTLAIVRDYPGKVFAVTAAALVSFLVLSAALVSRMGSLGTAIAVSSALLVAAVVTFQRFSLRRVFEVALFWRLLLLSALTFLILLLPGPSPIVMGLIATTVFLALLFFGKIISFKEVRQLFHMVAK